MISDRFRTSGWAGLVLISLVASPGLAQTVNCAGQPAWVATTTYSAGAQVTYSGSLYKALVSTTNVAPNYCPSCGWWQLVGTCGTPATCTTAPAVPTGLACLSKTATSVNLTWNAITAPTGCSVTYRLYNRGIQIQTGLTSPSATVTGLTTGTTYNFTVAAADAAGLSAQSSVLSVAPSAGYTITATAGSNGMISPTGSVVLAQGASQTFSITANSGYAVNSVTVDGASVGAVSSYTFSNVRAVHTISATFTAVPVGPAGYTWCASENGSFTLPGTCDVAYGANGTFAYLSGKTGTITFNNTTFGDPLPGAMKAGYYKTSAAQFTLAASAGAGGSISPSGSLTVKKGASQTFTITASSGYTISTVIVDGASVGAVSSYTFSNVQAAHSISAAFTAIAGPAGYTRCAGENGSFTLPGTCDVAYGANGAYAYLYGKTGTITFNNTTFGDPLPGVVKAGYYKRSATQLTLTASAGAGGAISPSGSVKVSPGASQSFTITPSAGYIIKDVTVDDDNQGAITTYTFSNVTSNHTISAAFQVAGSQTDKYGIKKLYSTTSGGREWFNAWDTGGQRTNDWGMLGTDPGLVVRGSTNVTIYGASGSRPGQMAVSGSNPRIYVRDSESEAIPPASSVKTWNNVEVTFFANSNLNSGIGWAGMEAVVKTNHLPDTWDCQTRGYGGRFLFDGRIDFEKEVSHPSDYNVQQELGTWAGGLPINRWIGMKLVARNCDNNTHVKLELYREVSLGSEISPSVPSGGGDWELLGTYTDTGTWSVGYGTAAVQCPFDNGKTDRSLPLTWPNWSVYLRTDDDNNKGLIQHLKWLSVREIDPLS